MLLIPLIRTPTILTLIVTLLLLYTFYIHFSLFIVCLPISHPQPVHHLNHFIKDRRCPAARPPLGAHWGE